MPKIKPRLTDTQIRNLKPKVKPYKVNDEGGLVILVRPTGTKVWQYPYKFLDNYNVHTIGQYPEVGVANARQKRDEIKANLKQGINPSVYKKIRRREAMGFSERNFEAIALEWFSKQSWVGKHSKNIQKKFAEDVFPYVGHIPIEKVKPQDVIHIIKIIEDRSAPDVAKRTCQHMSQIFEYAINKGLCDYNPAFGRGKIVKKEPVQHRRNLKEKDLPEFLQKLDEYRGGKLVQLAMKFLMLTMVRPGELRNARWDEIDTKNKLWRIPAARMKMKRDHVVPLSTQALDILEQLKPISGRGDLIFPGNRSPHIPISDVTLTKCLIIMGFHDKATAHGMRATASTILNENGFNSDAIERQLAHVEENKIRGSYNHAEYLPERARMLQWYADFLDEKKKEK
jgi:integrase